MFRLASFARRLELASALALAQTLGRALRLGRSVRVCALISRGVGAQVHRRQRHSRSPAADKSRPTMEMRPPDRRPAGRLGASCARGAHASRSSAGPKWRRARDARAAELNSAPLFELLRSEQRPASDIGTRAPQQVSSWRRSTRLADLCARPTRVLAARAG